MRFLPSEMRSFSPEIIANMSIDLRREQVEEGGGKGRPEGRLEEGAKEATHAGGGQSRPDQAEGRLEEGAEDATRGGRAGLRGG